MVERFTPPAGPHIRLQQQAVQRDLVGKVLQRPAADGGRLVEPVAPQQQGAGVLGAGQVPSLVPFGFLRGPGAPGGFFEVFPRVKAGRFPEGRNLVLDGEGFVQTFAAEKLKLFRVDFAAAGVVPPVRAVLEHNELVPDVPGQILQQRTRPVDQVLQRVFRVAARAAAPQILDQPVEGNGAAAVRQQVLYQQPDAFGAAFKAGQRLPVDGNGKFAEHADLHPHPGIFPAVHAFSPPGRIRGQCRYYSTFSRIWQGGFILRGKARPCRGGGFRSCRSRAGCGCPGSAAKGPSAPGRRGRRSGCPSGPEACRPPGCAWP